MRPAGDAQAPPGAWDRPGSGPADQAGDLGTSGASGGEPEVGRGRGGPPRLPPVRLAPRDELAAAARVAPLLRAARDVARWARRQADRAASLTAGGAPQPAASAAVAVALELAPAEAEAAIRVAAATGMLGREPAPGDVLASGDAEQVLAAWDAALEALLAAEDLDGLATALYTVGGPVRMEGLFDAYAAAAGTRRSQPGSPAPDQAAALSAVLETLADLGVVELGTEDSTGGLTVTLSPLGVWGVHRRLLDQGWHVPVLGAGS